MILLDVLSIILRRSHLLVEGWHSIIEALSGIFMPRETTGVPGNTLIVRPTRVQLRRIFTKRLHPLLVVIR